MAHSCRIEVLEGQRINIFTVELKLLKSIMKNCCYTCSLIFNRENQIQHTFFTKHIQFGTYISHFSKTLQYSQRSLKVAYSQKVQDSFFIAIFAIINIPLYYSKLLHPIHGIDKLLIYSNTF